MQKLPSHVMLQIAEPIPHLVASFFIQELDLEICDAGGKLIISVCLGKVNTEPECDISGSLWEQNSSVLPITPRAQKRVQVHVKVI